MHTGEFVSKSVFACSEADIQDFNNFTQGVLTQGLYTINEGYGICTPFDLDMLQGTPAVFLNDKRSLKPGDVKQWMIDEDINKRIKAIETRLLARSEGLKFDCVLQDAGIEINRTLLAQYFPLASTDTNITCAELLADSRAHGTIIDN